MKRLIYIITIFLMPGIWFCSCGSHKSAMKKETLIEETFYHQRKDTASFSEQVQKTEHEDVTETIEEVTTVYDTSQPADSATGRPPVLSETKRNIKRETNKQKQEDKSSNLNQSTSSNVHEKAVVNAAVDETKQKDETTVPRQIGGVVWALVALGGVIIVGWLIYKRRKK